MSTEERSSGEGSKPLIVMFAAAVENTLLMYYSHELAQVLNMKRAVYEIRAQAIEDLHHERALQRAFAFCLRPL